MTPVSSARRRRTNRFALLAPLAAGLVAATGASAQSGHLVPVGNTTERGATSVTPRAAAAGDVVWIHTAYLPPSTPVQFMLGALRAGFEIVVTRVTDPSGRINGQDSIQVTVPDWVTTDRPYLMIATDADYKPLGAADMFHPTDANGFLQRTGEVKVDKAGCPVLTGQADEIYFLSGDTSGLRSGDRVRVVGRATESGACGAGTTIEIRTLERKQPLP